MTAIKVCGTGQEWTSASLSLSERAVVWSEHGSSCRKPKSNVHINSRSCDSLQCTHTLKCPSRLLWRNLRILFEVTWSETIERFFCFFLCEIPMNKCVLNVLVMSRSFEAYTYYFWTVENLRNFALNENLFWGIFRLAAGGRRFEKSIWKRNYCSNGLFPRYGRSK